MTSSVTSRDGPAAAGRELDVGPIAKRLADPRGPFGVPRGAPEGWSPVAVHEAEQLIAEVRQLRVERLLLAKLAADTPQFDSPSQLETWQELRDAVLGDAGGSHV